MPVNFLQYIVRSDKSAAGSVRHQVIDNRAQESGKTAELQVPRHCIISHHTASPSYITVLVWTFRPQSCAALLGNQLSRHSGIAPNTVAEFQLLNQT